MGLDGVLKGSKKVLQIISDSALEIADLGAQKGKIRRELRYPSGKASYLLCVLSVVCVVCCVCCLLSELPVYVLFGVLCECSESALGGGVGFFPSLLSLSKENKNPTLRMRGIRLMTFTTTSANKHHDQQSQ